MSVLQSRSGRHNSHRERAVPTHDEPHTAVPHNVEEARQILEARKAVVTTIYGQLCQEVTTYSDLEWAEVICSAQRTPTLEKAQKSTHFVPEVRMFVVWRSCFVLSTGVGMAEKHEEKRMEDRDFFGMLMLRSIPGGDVVGEDGGDFDFDDADLDADDDYDFDDADDDEEDDDGDMLTLMMTSKSELMMYARRS